MPPLHVWSISCPNFDATTLPLPLHMKNEKHCTNRRVWCLPGRNPWTTFWSPSLRKPGSGSPLVSFHWRVVLWSLLIADILWNLLVISLLHYFFFSSLRGRLICRKVIPPSFINSIVYVKGMYHQCVHSINLSTSGSQPVWDYLGAPFMLRFQYDTEPVTLCVVFTTGTMTVEIFFFFCKKRHRLFFLWLLLTSLCNYTLHSVFVHLTVVPLIIQCYFQLLSVEHHV